MKVKSTSHFLYVNKLYKFIWEQLCVDTWHSLQREDEPPLKVFLSQNMTYFQCMVGM